MIRIYIIAICLFFNLKFIAQEKDTAYHLVGLGTGYFTDPDMAGPRGEFNLVYIFSKGNVLARLETGIAPFTNFGNMYRLYPTIGFTTRLKRKFSWHFGVGFGVMKGSRTYIDREVMGNSYIGNTGFIYKLTPKFRVTLDASLGMYEISSSDKAPLGTHTEVGYMPCLNLGFYYTFQK